MHRLGIWRLGFDSQHRGYGVFVHLFVGEATVAMLRGYYWFYNQELPLMVLVGLYGVPGSNQGQPCAKSPTHSAMALAPSTRSESQHPLAQEGPLSTTLQVDPDQLGQDVSQRVFTALRAIYSTCYIV